MKSYCKFEVKALRKEKCINELSKSFLIAEIKEKEGNVLEFKVFPNDAKKIKKELEKKEIKILSISFRGIYYTILNVLKSWGIIAGLVIGLAFFFIETMFVKDVEVWCDEQISESEIVALVKPYSVNKIRSTINTKDIEVKIYDSFENLSFVSVAVVGQVLIVNVKQEVKPSEMEDKISPILASDDGRITNIELVQGTLCVKVGDIVKKGDQLVMPYVINSDGEQQKIMPKAKIYADVWLASEVNHNSHYEEQYRTGKQVVKNEVLLCNLKIYDNNQTCPFENYDTIIKDKKIIENNILPFILRETTYYELASRVVEENFEDVKDEILERCKENNLQKMEEYDIIKRENIIIKQAGNITTVIYTSVVNREIGG